MSTIYFYFGYCVLACTYTLLFIISKKDVQVLTDIYATDVA